MNNDRPVHSNNNSGTKTAVSRDVRIKKALDIRIGDKLLPFVMIVLCLLFVCYLVYYLSCALYSPVKTQTAVYQTVYKNVTSKAFVVRSEQYVYSDASGTSVPLISNGDKVSKGQNVSEIYSSAESAENSLRLRELSNEISYYKRISQSSVINASDISLLDHNIYGTCNTLLDCISSGDLRSFSSDSDDFRTAVTKRQLSTGTTVDVSAKLTELQSEYDSLAGSASPSGYVTSPCAGYYVAETDGYENAYDYDNVLSITADEADSLCSSSPAAVPTNNDGKIIDKFCWYLVCVAGPDELVGCSVGDTFKISFPDSSLGELSFTVAAVNGSDFSSRAIVFKNMQMNESIAAFRSGNIRIRSESYSGFLIPSSAVRTLDGLKGVYVLTGNRIDFKRISSVYDGDDFSIVSAKDPDAEKYEEETTNAAGEKNVVYSYLKLYDSVITEGKDLTNGKFIR